MDTSLKRKRKGNTESIDKKECEWPNSGQLGKVDKPETNPYQVKNNGRKMEEGYTTTTNYRRLSPSSPSEIDVNANVLINVFVVVVGEFTVNDPPPIFKNLG